MFNYWMLTNHFVLEHLLKPLGYFFPTRHGADIIKHRRGFVEWTPFLDVLNEADASEVHVVIMI